MVEAMTGGALKKRGGVLIASKSVVYGDEEHTPAISQYHINVLESVHIPEPGSKISIGDEELLITPRASTPTQQQ